jgi:negative regulator of sigma E activity
MKCFVLNLIGLRSKCEPIHAMTLISSSNQHPVAAHVPGASAASRQSTSENSPTESALQQRQNNSFSVVNTRGVLPPKKDADATNSSSQGQLKPEASEPVNDSIRPDR